MSKINEDMTTEKKIAVRWLYRSIYRSEATIETIIAEKERTVAQANENLPEPYTVAQWKVRATSDSEGSDELYIDIDRWETDVEQERRLKAREASTKREIDKQTKAKQNREDPEWSEYTRLQKKFKLPM